MIQRHFKKYNAKQDKKTASDRLTRRVYKNIDQLYNTQYAMAVGCYVLICRPRLGKPYIVTDTSIILAFFSGNLNGGRTGGVSDDMHETGGYKAEQHLSKKPQYAADKDIETSTNPPQHLSKNQQNTVREEVESSNNPPQHLSKKPQQDAKPRDPRLQSVHPTEIILPEVGMDEYGGAKSEYTAKREAEEKEFWLGDGEAAWDDGDTPDVSPEARNDMYTHPMMQFDEEGNAYYYLQLVKGDPKALEDLLSRGLGKPVQGVDLTSQGHRLTIEEMRSMPTELLLGLYTEAQQGLLGDGKG